MKKHLHRIGNSYGVIIDKSIRRMLHLGPRTVLDVSTDGQRIIIERTNVLLADDELGRARERLALEEERSLARADKKQRTTTPSSGEANRRSLDIDAPRIWLQLERVYCISQQQLEQLYHRPKPRYGRVAGWMCAPGAALSANEQELATMQRLKVCLEQLRSGEGWATAIEHALRAFPLPATTAEAAPLVPAAGLQAAAST